MGTDNGRRLAKNTMLLYIRMVVVMGVSIFTSRIILESLGVTEYGVFNVVGGIAFSFGFFSSSMTNASQRYLSYGHGEGNIEKVKEYFNLIAFLYIAGSILILCIGGGLGFWIVSKLNIPPNLYSAGIIVYYTTLVSLIITLFSSMYDAVLIAQESLNFYAYISIAEAAAKLGVAYLIFLADDNKLSLYAILLLIVTIIVKGSLIIYCINKYPECRIKLSWQPEKLKGVLKFMGWNGIGTIMWVINEQGINILINLFFGPVINAARAIANQVNVALNNFTNNFFLALNPQIIKKYASGDKSGSISIMSKASVFSFCLLWLLCLPVLLRREYILKLWLNEVPDCTSIFLVWILIYSLINVLTKPQWTIIQAVGNLKQYIINGCITMLGAIPIGYVLFKLSYPPQAIFIVLTILRFFYVIVSLFTIRKFITFSIFDYCKNVLSPIVFICFLSTIIMHNINQLFPQTFVGFLSILTISILITGVVILSLIGKNMRLQLIGIIKSCIK